MKEYDDFVNVLNNDCPTDKFFGMLEDFAMMDIMKRMEFVDHMSNDHRISPKVVRKYISEFESNPKLMEMQDIGLKVTKVQDSDIDRLNIQADSMEGIIEVLNDDITMSPVQFALLVNRFAMNVANAGFLIQMFSNVEKAIENGEIEEDLED